MICKSIYQFWEELKEVFEEFFSFLKKEKALRWFTAILILIFWGIKIVNDDIFIDSEVMTLEPYALLHSWYGSRRFTLIFIKRFFHMIRLVPYLSNFLFVIALWGVMMILCFCMMKWFPSEEDMKERKGALFLMTALFVSCPSLTEQYAYTLQAFEITLVMAFCLVAAFSAGQAIYHKKSPIWYLAAVWFLMLGLGAYQAFSVFYIALVLISYLGIYEKGKTEHVFLYGVIHVLLFVAGFVLYIVIADFLCKWKAGDSSYVDSMFLWGTASASECLNYIKDEFRILYCGVVPSLYNRFFGMVALVVTLLLMVRSMKYHFKYRIWYVFALVMLIISPLFVSLLTGMRTPVRGQLVFPLVFSFYATVLWCMICYWITSNAKMAAGFGKTLCLIVTAIFFYQAWIQGMNLVQLNQTIHDTTKHDMLTAERMYTDICRVADRDDMQNCHVVFVGTRDARMPQVAARGECIGHSFFDFQQTNIGITNRVTGLFNLFGMNLGGATPEDYEEALEASKDRACWPASEAVFKLDSGCVVVKLSY
jgi:hypothetical protein